MKLISTFLTVLACTGLAMAGVWLQRADPNGNLSSANEMPVEWSVALDERIHWRITLPETGQNTPTVFGNKVFFPPTNSSKPTPPSAETSSPRAVMPRQVKSMEARHPCAV
ncbi:MAG: hypothetical protein VXX36_14915 [Verrucomicrobiota bacterium]|nr:hypothetical protein [Verrucomicrobiota bacterium]